MGFWGAIKNAASDFVSDPWSVAVPMYGITKGVVKAANGDYHKPAPTWSPSPAPTPKASDNRAGRFAMMANMFQHPPKSSGFIQSMTPAAKQERAPFAGAWDYQAGKGPQWSGPKPGNRI